MKKEFRRLPCKLTPEEQRQRGKTLAERVEEYNREEQAGKAAAEVSRGKLKNLRRDIDALADVVDTGTERRDVECVIHRNEQHFEVAWYRTDTQECVERRPMTETERQQPLFDVDDDAEPTKSH